MQSNLTSPSKGFRPSLDLLPSGGRSLEVHLFYRIILAVSAAIGGFKRPFYLCDPEGCTRHCYRRFWSRPEHYEGEACSIPVNGFTSALAIRRPHVCSTVSAPGCGDGRPFASLRTNEHGQLPALWIRELLVRAILVLRRPIDTYIYGPGKTNWIGGALMESDRRSRVCFAIFKNPN